MISTWEAAVRRSEINSIIKEMEELVKAHGFHLPPFCSWTPEEWQEKGHECDEIRECMLGWDITDFGSGDFDHVGFALITIRNGKLGSVYTKPYAEKLIMLREGQTAPMHYHWYKREDIINRGGGDLIISVRNGLEDRSYDEKPVTVYLDGVTKTVPSGYGVVIPPGSSISLPQYQYHDFAVVPGTGKILIGEVSMCNDDNNDNCFYNGAGRFPEIEEDEPPYRLLCNEYPEAKG